MFKISLATFAYFLYFTTKCRMFFLKRDCKILKRKTCHEIIIRNPGQLLHPSVSKKCLVHENCAHVCHAHMCTVLTKHDRRGGHVRDVRENKFHVNLITSKLMFLLLTIFIPNLIEQIFMFLSSTNKGEVIRLGTGISTEIGSVESRRKIKRQLSRPFVQWASFSVIYALSFPFGIAKV
jgi:hypothetical protein